MLKYTEILLKRLQGKPIPHLLKEEKLLYKKILARYLSLNEEQKYAFFQEYKLLEKPQPIMVKIIDRLIIDLYLDKTDFYR